MSCLLVRGGRVVDPRNGLDDLRDVLLRDGAVAGVEMPGMFAAVDAEVLDARGCVVAPGLVDVHVHLRVRSPKICVPLSVWLCTNP